jgi:biotin carboxyl carrier protein
MTFEVEVGQRRRRVELQRAGGDWTVWIDGHAMQVNLEELPAGWSMLIRSGDAGPGTDDEPRWSQGGRSHEIAIERLPGGARLVSVDGRTVTLSLMDARTRAARRHGGGADQGPRRTAVVAPMPGRVVKVLVAPGETVAARQGLVVVEAMKMENELRAPRAGQVAEVRVTDGAAVESGTVLVVLH